MPPLKLLCRSQVCPVGAGPWFSTACLLKAGEGRARLRRQGGHSYRRAAALQGCLGLFSRTSKDLPSLPEQHFHTQLRVGPLPQGSGDQGFHISKPPLCILKGVFLKR